MGFGAVQEEGLEVKRGVAVGVGGNGGAARVALALALAGGVGVRAGVEVQHVGGVGPAVQAAARLGGGAAGRGGQRRVVLLVVGPGVEAGVVGGDAVPAQVDA